MEDLISPNVRVDPEKSRVLQARVADLLYLQLSEVLAWSGRKTDLPQAELAYRAIARMRRERRLRTVLDPAFRYCLRALRKTALDDFLPLHVEFAQHLADFVWHEPESWGAQRRWVVQTDDRGGLRCASRGRYVELGPAYASQPVEFCDSDAGITGSCVDGMVFEIPLADLRDTIIAEPEATIEDNGYAVSVYPSVANGSISVSARDPWLRVRLTGTNQRHDGNEFFGSDDGMYDCSPRVSQFANALEHLNRYWPESSEELSIFTRVIVPASFEPSTYRAFTVSSRQGAIFIGPAPTEATVEMLLHENAHVKLRQLQVIDSLLKHPLDQTVRVSVPWRRDPRPLPGVLEGAFVFAHVAEYERRRLEMSGESGATLDERVKSLRFAVDCIRQRADLTSLGVTFIGLLDEWISELERFAKETSRPLWSLAPPKDLTQPLEVAVAAQRARN